MGTGMMDIRERQRAEEARKKEKEAEDALRALTKERMKAEEEEALRVQGVIEKLTQYHSSLPGNSGTQATGSRSIPGKLKRRRSPSQSRSRTSSPSPAPTPSRSPTPRKRSTVRAGKGKGRRTSYSRSPSRRSLPRSSRPTPRPVPGLYTGKEPMKALYRTREFSPPRTPSTRTYSPARSPSWQTVTSRRRGRR